MKRAFSIIILIYLLVSVSILPGCHRVGSAMNGSGKIIDHNVEIDGFNSLNIEGDFKVEVSRAETFKVTLSTDDNLIHRVLISLEQKTLKIRIEAPATFFPSSLKLVITMPEIVSLNLSGDARAVLTGFKSTDDFTLFLSEHSSLHGYLEAGTVQFHVSDASQVSLKGKALMLELESSGGSKIDLEEFSLNSAAVKLDEVSEAILAVSGKFDVVLNNKSRIYYLGNPLISDTSISGGSTMVHK